MLARSLTRDAHHDDDDDDGGDYDYDEEDSDNGDVLSRLFRGEYSSRAPRRPLKADKRTRLNPPQACFHTTCPREARFARSGFTVNFEKEEEKGRRRGEKSYNPREGRRKVEKQGEREEDTRASSVVVYARFSGCSGRSAYDETYRRVSQNLCPRIVNP